MKIVIDTDILSVIGEADVSKRAVRRHDRNRVILERMRRRHWHVKSPGRLSKNNTVCSCWMCGNPRKYFGKMTIQEKKASQAWPIQDVCDFNLFYL